MINHPQKSLNECNAKSPISEGLNLDEFPKSCEPREFPNKRDVNDQSLNWLKDVTNQKTGLGTAALCDPQSKGRIYNDIENPERNTIYRYSKAIQGCDEAMHDLFRDLVVFDENGKAYPIPIIWGTQEKAVAAILLDNVRKDETLVVDRIRLPMLAIYQSGIQPNLNRYAYHKAINYMNREDGKPGFTYKEKYERDTIFGVAKGIPVDITYTLYAWTLYLADMNQILEQILPRFSQVASLRVTGVPFEVIVKLDSIANNLDIEPGDQAIRVIKYEFNLTAESYIPQPITRQKAILKSKIEFVEGLTEDQIVEVTSRLEESTKNLKC